MSSCVVDNCCFCFDLRVGSLIIGYLSLIGNFILSIVVGMAVAGGGVLVAQDDKDQKAAGGILLVMAVILLVILIINLVFSIALLVGIHNNKRGHVKAYLIFSMICIFLLVIQFLGSFAGAVQAADIVRSIISILLNIYFWIVIRSYWLKMGEVSKNPPMYSA